MFICDDICHECMDLDYCDAAYAEALRVWGCNPTDYDKGFYHFADTEFAYFMV